MPVTDLLERNHKLYSDEVALVELNPLEKDTRKTTWKEYDLVQQTSAVPYRREITWSIFDEKANRVANMLLGRGMGAHTIPLRFFNPAQLYAVTLKPHREDDCTKR